MKLKILTALVAVVTSLAAGAMDVDDRLKFVDNLSKSSTYSAKSDDYSHVNCKMIYVTPQAVSPFQFDQITKESPLVVKATEKDGSCTFDVNLVSMRSDSGDMIGGVSSSTCFESAKQKWMFASATKDDNGTSSLNQLAAIIVCGYE